MLFNTPQFLLFFAIAVSIYWIIPNSLRKIWLLVCSYYFYMNWNAVYGLLLFGVTLVTYIVALYVEKNRNNIKTKFVKIIFGLAIFACLLSLAIFKYLGFVTEVFTGVLNFLGSPIVPLDVKIILPVGISFYTLQALGYLIDVYRGEIYAEKNIITYALFISFFPQLVAGPIERSKNLLKQIYTPKKFSYENLRRGLVMMLWGLFLKMVIADNVSIIVDNVYASIESIDGIYILLATCLFAFQIYCDFYGYSIIAVGVAKTMGFSLINNFEAPYFSKSVKEFWRRWHISLSSWFRDYLYIPLGGNRKGKVRQELNLLIVFSISGLWHGASFAFIIWGFLNGIYQVISDRLRNVRNWIKSEIQWKDCSSNRILSMFSTYILISITLMFFRAGTLHNVDTICRQLFSNGIHISALISGSISDFGLEPGYVFVIIISLIVLGIVDYMKYSGKDIIVAFFSQEWWFRTALELALIFSIIAFGKYGEIYDTASFIYFQF